MMLFLRFVWPRSPRSLAAWTPLILVGAVSCIGLSLALGFRDGLLAQQAAAVQRDGPPGLPPRTHPVEGPLRASRLGYTTYGPLVVTTIAGDEGLHIGLPGIDRIGADGSALASPGVLAQLRDDWTGEIEAWLGGRTPGTLPDAALTHPREMVIVEFVATVPESVASSFYPIRPGRVKWPVETSFVIVGLLILVLPSVALARAGAARPRSRQVAALRPSEGLGRAAAAACRRNCSRHGRASAGGRPARLGRLRRLHVVVGRVHPGWHLVLDEGPAPPRSLRRGAAAGRRPGRTGEHRQDGLPRRTGPPRRYTKGAGSSLVPIVHLGVGPIGRSRRHSRRLRDDRQLHAVRVAHRRRAAPERRRPRGVVADLGIPLGQAPRRPYQGADSRVENVPVRRCPSRRLRHRRGGLARRVRGLRELRERLPRRGHP